MDSEPVDPQTLLAEHRKRHDWPFVDGPQPGDVVLLPVTSRMDEPDDRPTVVLDFDGVLHDHQGNVSGPPSGDPLPGAAEAVRAFRAKYRVVVLSARASDPGGAGAVRRWLADQGIEVDDVVRTKPPAVAYVDDRAVRFGGDWGAVHAAVDRLVVKGQT